VEERAELNQTLLSLGSAIIRPCIARAFKTHDEVIAPRRISIRLESAEASCRNIPPMVYFESLQWCGADTWYRRKMAEPALCLAPSGYHLSHLNHSHVRLYQMHAREFVACE
jgi:hypothetical protein